MFRALLIITLTFSFFACQNEVKKEEKSQLTYESIQEIGKKIFDESTGKLDYKIARQYITSVDTFVINNPKDEKSPTLLMKAAEVARTTKSYTKALELYQTIYEKYPNSKEAPQALFLKGFTLDNELHQIEAAKKIYEEFLEKYPDNDFADDTKFLLENLGKSEEELVKEFEARAKKQQ